MKRRALNRWLLGIVCVFSLLSSQASASASGWSSVGEGMINGRAWAVEAGPSPSRAGVCLETLVFREGPEPLGSGRCSRPAEHRGNLIVAADLSRGGGAIVTVIGGAFNPAVSRLTYETFSGQQRRIPLQSLTGVVRPLGSFRFAAMAVRGAWCARRLFTEASDGRILWTTNWREFSSSISTGLRFDPRPACQG
jgi:hypothetical protein